MENVVFWTFSTLLGSLVVVLIIWFFWKFPKGLYQAVKITRFILKDNRDTRGNGWGKYSADRFVEVWCSNKKTHP